MGAVGAIAAIFGIWPLVQSEYLPADGRHAQISLIDDTTSQFDSLVQQYIRLAREKNPEVMEYYHRWIDDPRREKMIDLGTMPMSHWPSIEVYRAFNEYLFSSVMLVQTSADEGTSIKLQDRIIAYGKNFEALKQALDASPPSLRSHDYVMRPGTAPRSAVTRR